MTAPTREHRLYRKFTTFEPIAVFGMDFLGPIGPKIKNHAYILVGVDYFTRLMFVESMEIADREGVARVWLHVWSKFGLSICLPPASDSMIATAASSPQISRTSPSTYLTGACYATSPTT